VDETNFDPYAGGDTFESAPEPFEGDW
jgi:hypothetical protein